MKRVRRGFTLIEVLVSVAAGGIVLVGLLVLSKSATAAFNEEVRVGAVQTSVRAALLRIQGDLTLASYQSTPNLAADRGAVRRRGATANATAATLGAVKSLAGLRIDPRGSDGRAPRNVANLYANDVLEVAGNLAATDAFVVLDVLIGGGSGAGCDRVILNMDSPPIWRLRDSTAPDPNVLLLARLQALFVPAAPAADNANYLVRLVDPSGRAQYLSTCSGRASLTLVGAGSTHVAIDVTAGPTERLLTTADTGGVGGWPGRSVGGCTINPVYRVRYEIGTAAVLAPSLGAVDPSSDANPKYDLYRTYLNAAGDPVELPELVAEYIAGMRLGLTVDNAPVGAPGDPRTLLRVPADDASAVRAWAGTVDATVDLPAAAVSVGPQRIRSVAVEVSARVALADRDRPELAGSSVRRYCVPGACVPGAQVYARARTLAMEVAIRNHAGVFF